MSETGRKKFIRLAEKRVSRAIDDIRLIGNLSERSNYQYDDDQVDEIFSVLRAELTACSKRFKATRKSHRGTTFRLVDKSKP